MFNIIKQLRLFWRVAGVLAILLAILTLTTTVFAANETVTVNFASSSGAPTYRASGFIYGIAPDASQPPQSLMTDIKVRNMRSGGSQINCPNGGYVNGDYATRWNVARAYWGRAHAIGARYQMILAGIWGSDGPCSVPRWPGDNGNWTEYNNFINQLIDDVIANGMTGPDLIWDMWNEPNIFFWGRTQAQYLEMHRRGFQLIRSRIPGAVISGPSLAGVPGGYATDWLATYLDYVKANNVVPNILSWHDLPGDPVADVANANSMLSARGISVEGYSINEYGSSGDDQQPGPTGWYIARLERANVQGGHRANWGGGNGLYQTMGGQVTSSWQPMGAWWMYKRYADQTGQRTSLTPSTSVDGVVFQDSGARKSINVLGKRTGGGTGNVAVVYQNIPTWLQNAGAVNVLVERMPAGSTYVVAPTVVSNGSVAVGGNSLTVNINWSNALDGYAITLTPPSGTTPTPPPTNGQYEAENGSYGGGAAVATDHTGYTGTGFVAFMTTVGSYSSFTVSVPSAGSYPVTLRYSAGPNGPTTDRTMSVYVNGSDVLQTVLARTSTWDVWATKAETLSLNAGSNTIRYQYDSSDTGWINVDNIVVGSGGGGGTFPVAGTYYRIINRNSGKVVDVSGVSTADGANVHQWTWVGGTNQQWQFVATDSGYYRVVARHSGKVVDVSGVSTADGANVHQWTWLGGANQQWRVNDLGNGYYSLIARHSGKALEVSGCGTADGVNIQQWTWQNNNCQQWQIVP